MNAQFETTVVVKAHAKFGAFRAEDGKFYKPSGTGMKLEDFAPGESYGIKGYSSESGKTNYITDMVTGPVANTFILPTEAPKRRMAPPAEPNGEKGIADRVTARVTTSHTRDFVKEAKGKTFSLIVAALSHGSMSVKDTLTTADELLKGIEDRGYF